MSNVTLTVFENVQRVSLKATGYQRPNTDGCFMHVAHLQSTCSTSFFVSRHRLNVSSEMHKFKHNNTTQFKHNNTMQFKHNNTMQFPYSLNTKDLAIVRQYTVYIHCHRYALSHRVWTAVTRAEQQQQQQQQ